MFKDAKDYDMKLPSAHKGRTLSAEFCKKIRAANIGKTIPAETRAKISATLKNRKLSTEHRAKQTKYIYHTPAGVFDDAREAVEKNKCIPATLRNRCDSKGFPDWYRVKKDQKQ